MKPEKPFATLRRLARRQTRAAAIEVCDFCSVPLAPQHRHLLEMTGRRIICACDACALRFENVVAGRFKLIPREARALPGFRLSDEQWESLALPIALVFISQNSVTGKATALYPSPAGTTESLLTLENWQSVAADNPELEAMKPDVEALLVNRVSAHRDYFIAPVDICFELAGLIRKNWRGLSGGAAVWVEIETFFARLREQTASVTPGHSTEDTEIAYATPRF